MHISNWIDHTILRPNLTIHEMIEFISLTRQYKFASICIPPSWLRWMRDRTDTPIGTVIGFPLGFTNSNQKLFEIGQALCDGADEVDIVLNISNIVDENWDKVNEELNDLHGVRSNCIKKIIVETCYLTEQQLDMVTRLVARYDFDYIKTSTGFGSRGASVRDIEIIKEAYRKGYKLKIKASGGIKTLDDVQKFINLGCHRVGTSSAKTICEAYDTNQKLTDSILKIVDTKSCTKDSCDCCGSQRCEDRKPSIECDDDDCM